MRNRTIIAAALILFCAGASAQFKTIELAHEIDLADFVVPVTTSGVVNIRVCETCESIKSRLTPNTRFVINKQNVGLQEFRSRLAAVRDRSSRSLTILQHLETNTVTSIAIRL